MFVRDLDYVEQGRHEMIEYLRSLSPESSDSAEVAWVMDDFSGGTFPRWFQNVTWRDGSEPAGPCPFPCSEGVFNETTQMWGCPLEDVNLVSPLGPTNMHTYKRERTWRSQRRNLRLYQSKMNAGISECKPDQRKQKRDFEFAHFSVSSGKTGARSELSGARLPLTPKPPSFSSEETRVCVGS